MECLDRASSDQPSAANLNWIVAVAASTARAARLRTASAAGEPVQVLQALLLVQLGVEGEGGHVQQGEQVG